MCGRRYADGALRQTNYVKSIVTAQGKMDLEHKGKQSYQGWMCARLLAFSNGDLQALFDRSDGFYRRQLVLTTKEKPVDRVDDPDLSEKMKAEIEAYSSGPLRDCSGWWQTTSSSPKASAPKRTGRPLSGTTTMCLTSGIRGLHPAESGCVHQLKGLLRHLSDVV